MERAGCLRLTGSWWVHKRGCSRAFTGIQRQTDVALPGEQGDEGGKKTIRGAQRTGSGQRELNRVCLLIRAEDGHVVCGFLLRRGHLDFSPVAGDHRKAVGGR